MAKDLKFEEMMPYFEVCGTVDVTEGPQSNWGPDHCECPPASTNSPCMITTQQDLCIDVKWEVKGRLAKFLCGTWKLSIDGEQWGCPEFCMDKSIDVPYDCDNTGPKFNEKITFKAGDLKKGFYKMVVCLSFCACDGTPGPIAAFVECPPIKVWEAGI